MTKGTRMMIIARSPLIGEAFRAYFSAHAKKYRVLLRSLSRMAAVPSGSAPPIILFLGMDQCPNETRAAMALYPLSKYLLTGKFRDPLIAVEWLRLGIHGLIDESSEQITLQVLEKALSKVQAGEIWASRRVLSKMCQESGTLRSDSDSLTRREEEIMRLVNMGLSNQDIGKRLHISEKTVKRHLTNIYRKMEVQNRIQAVLKHQEEDPLPATVYSFPAVNS